MLFKDCPHLGSCKLQIPQTWSGFCSERTENLECNSDEEPVPNAQFCHSTFSPIEQVIDDACRIQNQLFMCLLAKKTTPGEGKEWLHGSIDHAVYMQPQKCTPCIHQHPETMWLVTHCVSRKRKTWLLGLQNQTVQCTKLSLVCTYKPQDFSSTRKQKLCCMQDFLSPSLESCCPVNCQYSNYSHAGGTGERERKEIQG